MLIWHIKTKSIKLVVFKCLLIKAQGAVALQINMNPFKVTKWICALAVLPGGTQKTTEQKR